MRKENEKRGDFMPLRVAVASSDGKYINQHFGHAQQFLIFDIHDDGNYGFIELRKSPPSCSGGVGNGNARAKTLDLIKDADVVLVSQIGPGAASSLIAHGIQPYMVPTFIEEALKKLASRIVTNNKLTNND